MLLCLLLVFASASAGKPNVKIGLQTSWTHTPLLQEASEFFAKEGSPALFWQFVDLASNVSISSSDRDQYDFALRAGRELRLLPEQQSLLQISLASRAFSPAVEMHRSLALAEKVAGDAFAVVGTDKRVVSKVSELGAALQNAGPIPESALLKEDHLFGSRDAVVAIVYGNIGSGSLAAFRQELARKSPHAGYVLRHFPPVDAAGRRVRLSGFGVELHLKSTEYKVVDDSHAAASKGETSSSLDALEPVPKGEVSGLGARIAQTIASSKEPLEALQRLSQNFPSECHAYRKVKLESRFIEAISENQQRMQPGHTAVLINGRHVNVANVNFFELLDIVSEELRTSVSLRSIVGLSSKTARELTIRPTQQDQGGSSSPYFDLRSRHLRFLNDVEKDAVSSRWPPSLRNFLRQQWPGMPYTVRRNAMTAVALIDLGRQDVVCAMAEIGVMMGLIPGPELSTLGAVRFGVVVVGDQPRSDLMARAFAAFHHDPRRSMQFLQGMCADRALEIGPEDAFEAKVVRHSGISMATLRGADPDSVTHANAWSENEFGVPVSQLASGFRLFMNGKLIDSDGSSSLKDALHMSIPEQTQQLQILIYRGQLGDHVGDIFDWFLNFFRAAKAYSRFGVSASAGGAVTPFVPLATPLATRNTELNTHLKDLSFYGSCEPFCTISHIVMANISTASGRQLLRSAVSRGMEGSSSVRIAIVPYGTKSSVEILSKWKAGRLHEIDESVASPAVPASALVDFLSSTFGIVQGVITNGRVMRINEGERFSRVDFESVEANEEKKRGTHVANTIHRVNPALRGAELNMAIMQACSVLSSEEVLSFPRYDIRTFAVPTLTIPSKSGEPVLVIDALLDPLSEGGKKFSSILLKLIGMFDCELNLVLNPILNLEDLPLKQFYRYVASTELSFRKDGSLDASATTTASFPSLPSQTLFSMSLDVPDSWLVDAIAAPHDLDNLRLADIGDGENVGALYELTHLTIEGNCKDISSRKSPVRGMQVQVESSLGQRYESLVTENGGYFQLKAGPGVWNLSLLGRANELFEIESPKSMIVNQFSGGSRSVNVKRRPGSYMPLLMEDTVADEKLQRYVELRQRVGAREAAAQVLNPKSGWFSSSKPATVEHQKNVTIHIFSVASGHLYERFLSIMMYTTVRSTKNPVKFWFLKQFLSPQFKRFLPVMAEKYGFQFELITYKWPHWLRRQTEKQRHIWAYKILFLDVLFPSSVDRVIFVDADQIVRTDLAALATMDIQGAPYAFTPFCSGADNRRLETKGFRFWESGYWKDTLQGLPYHISALFVVDLKRFRQLAAGDMLRGSYESLSRDPGSLQNLDQDLPNVLQQRIQIFSLPEEWLYCATWCSDEAFKSSLSVDLCNNPMHKFTKLEVARSLFPEWNDWDKEMTSLRKQIDSHDLDLKVLALQE